MPLSPQKYLGRHIVFVIPFILPSELRPSELLVRSITLSLILWKDILHKSALMVVSGLHHCHLWMDFKITWYKINFYCNETMCRARHPGLYLKGQGHTKPSKIKIILHNNALMVESRP